MFSNSYSEISVWAAGKGIETARELGFEGKPMSHGVGPPLQKLVCDSVNHYARFYAPFHHQSPFSPILPSKSFALSRTPINPKSFMDSQSVSFIDYANLADLGLNRFYMIMTN
jgi:hypothetical protein